MRKKLSIKEGELLYLALEKGRLKILTLASIKEKLEQTDRKSRF